MAKQAKQSSKSAFGTPEEGNLIMVGWRNHRTGRHWDTGMIYHERFVTPELVTVHQAVIYDPDNSIIGSGGELAGTLAGEWNDVEFWTVWEGESRQEHNDRMKDLEVTQDEWFNGEKYSSIRGSWSKPKIGPAFKHKSIRDKWTRPKNGKLVEVHARKGYLEHQRGKYFAEAEMIYTEDRLGTKRVEVRDMSPLDPNAMRLGIAVALGHVKSIPDNVVVETTSSDRFRYGSPFLPFSEWVRFRVLNDDGTPCSDWIPAPHSEEWGQEERIRRTTATLERNKERYEDLRAMVLDSYPTEPDLRMRIVRLKQLHKNAPNAEFDRSLDPDILKSAYEQHYKAGKISKEQYERNTAQLTDGLSGGGEFFLGKWIDFLQGEILALQEALDIQPNGTQRNHLYEMMTGPAGAVFEMGLIEKVRRGEQTEEETRQIIHSISDANKRREIEKQLNAARELAGVQVLAEKIVHSKDHSVISAEDDSTDAHGPFHTPGELAQIVGMTESGVRKILKGKEPRILGVRIHAARNGKRGRWSISHRSLEKVKAKVGAQDHNK